MKLYKGSCLSLIVLSALFEVIQSNESERDSKEARRGRVNGRIVKLYSGSKPDPVLCFEEGFKADPTDCSIFYRCVQSFGGKYSVFRFQCGPGTVYDPETEVCNHPSSTKRSQCSGAIASSVPARHEVDENDIDFQELPSPITTISPLYLSHRKNASEAFTLSTVNIRDSATSSNLFTTTTANQQFSEAFNNLGIYWNNKYTTSSQVPSFSTKPPRSDRSDPCTSDGFVGDSYDCKKFYRCVSNFRGSFIRYEFVCGESTVWDDDKQSCNYAWAVRSTRCGRDANDDNRLLTSNVIEQDKPKFTSNYNDATTRYHNEYIGTDDAEAVNFGVKLNNYYTSMTSEKPISNNINNNRAQITNNYNDASTQYLNENTVTENHPVVINFTTNQHNTYNPQPNEYQINYGITESQIKVTEVKEDFTASQTTFTQNKPSSTSKRNDSFKLLQICRQSGFIGDPNDCQKFYRCVDSGQGSFTRYDFSCSQGTVWDSSIEACNHAWAVKECGSKLTTQTLTTENSILNPSSSVNIEENQDKTDEDDSDYSYLNQINQENTKMTTPKTETTVSLVPCSSSGFFKNSVDCKKFYKCVENGRGSFTRFDYNCGEGTLWDETIEACNHDWAVKYCKTDSDGYNDTGIMTTVTLVQTTTQKNIYNKDYDSIYGIDHSMSTPDTFMDLSSSTTSKEIPNSYNRKCNRNGFMGDKENCKVFYRCVENGHNGYIRYEFSCGDGTVWDPTIEACNYDREVEDCRNSSSNNIYDNNFDNIDSMEDIDSGYVTPSNKEPDNSIQTTLLYTTTQIAENNNNVCKSLGFIGDTEHCEKFYRCVDNGNGGFTRIAFTCGEGTVWDSSIEACNHRWAVEKCGKSSDNEISETTSYPVATITNDMSDITKQPEESHTSTQPTSAQETHSDNKCTSEGFFGSTSEDCKTFYRCVDNGEGGYTKYDFHCVDGTIWDESIQACNHDIGNTTCGRGTPSSASKPLPDSTSTVSTSSMESNTPTSTVNTDGPQHDNKCISEGFMADSSDCRKFYRCVNNGKGGLTKFEFSCGEGTVWIQDIQACDHDTDDTICNISKSTTVKISTTVVDAITTSSTQSSPDNIVTASISSTTENNYINKNDSDKCSSEGFYANKYDCKRFYRCVDDGKDSYIKYEFTCAEGTAWDTRTQSCNYLSEVNSCQNHKIPQTETKPDSDDNAGSEPQQDVTTTPVILTTTSTRPNQSTCEEEGFFGDTEDCKKFYRCVRNEKEGFTKYVFTCGDQTIWDQDITACNHPHDVSNPSCGSEDSSSSNSITSSTVDVSNNTDYTSAPVTTLSPSTTVAYSTTTTKDTNSNCSDSNKDNMNNNNYTCTKAGFYADPNDCKKFYRCVDWENNGEKFSIYHFDCGDGTIWDPALETCNHEESVYPPRNCNGSHQQNHNNSESPSTTGTPSETESTSTYETTTTSVQPSTSETKPITSTTQKSTTESSTKTPSTTQSKPTTTTQKSTTQISTTQSKPSSTTSSTTTTTTTNTTTTTQKSTTEKSTTTTLTTREPSTQQTSTSSSEESTTEPSTQSTTDITIASNTDQTTTIKQSTDSEATTSNSYETTVTTNQMPSTTEQSTTSTEVSTSTEEISPQTTDSQSSTTESLTTNTQDSTTEANSSPNKDCPETEDDQYLYVCPTSFKRHPKYCNMFYQCTDDSDNQDIKVAVFNCPNNTIYDESKTQCVEEEKADKKCKGQISQRNRIKRFGLGFNEPVTVSKDSMACSSAGHFPFERNEKCSPVLLKCEYSKSGKLKGHVYKCPEGYVYWTISRRCEVISKVKDCKRSTYPWDKRYDIPVERHNISH